MSAWAQHLWLPQDTLDETFPRGDAENVAAITSGTMLVVGGCVVPKGGRVSKIGFISGITAASTPTHQWALLIDQGKNVLAKSADRTTEAWAGNAAKDFVLATPYEADRDLPVYLGLVVTAGTPPQLSGVTLGVTGIANQTPRQCFLADTGLTDPASLSASQVTYSASTVAVPYAYIK